VKTLDDRKLATLLFHPDELLALLRRHGYLPAELTGPDVGVVSIDAEPGHFRYCLTLEGDSLPEQFRYRGYAVPAQLDLRPVQSECTPP
jgi:hypothetical protein